MKRTARHAHLAEKPDFRIGQIVTRGQKIGIVGNSGAPFPGGSYELHLHTDIILGSVNHIVRSRDIEQRLFYPDPRELIEYAVDNELYGGKDFQITQYFLDPFYEKKLGYPHYGLDSIPLFEGTPWIYWNRSKIGIVSYVGFDPGYGWVILIVY